MAQRTLVLAVVAWFVTVWLSPYVGAAEPQIKPGDKVVTLTTAPLMSGSEKLAEVQPGVELTVTSVKAPWLGVTVSREGKDVKGWIYEGNLVPKPRLAFVKLFVGYLYTAKARFVVERAQARFTSVDGTRDGVLTLGEYRSGTRKPTLDDLNHRLRQEMDRQLSSTPENIRRLLVMTPGFQIDLETYVAEFQGWRAKPDPSASLKSVERFVTTKDIRRDAYLRGLLDAEDPGARARRAEALFDWADEDRDKRLSLEEYRRIVVGPIADIPRLTEKAHRGDDTSSHAVLTLAKLLQDEREYVRSDAAEALARIGPNAQGALSALVQATHDDDWSVRRYVAESLGNIGGVAKAAIPALEELARDKDSSVRRAAGEALKRIRTEK
ncbi:MAG: HEAT repeat domain-containing protein [Planctomycetota bacterium]